MTNDEREALITEAAKAMLMVGQGDVSAEYAWESQYEEVQDELIEQARVAFGVFEQAHTSTDHFRDVTKMVPTDDGRGGLKRAGDVHDGPPIDEVTAMFDGWEGAPTWAEDPFYRDAAIRWHARGVIDGWNARRPVQGEPTEAQVEAFKAEWWAAKDEGDDGNKVRRGLRAAFQTGENR